MDEAPAKISGKAGIPRAIAADAAPAGAPIAAGIVFVAPDGDVLLLRRASTEQNYAGHWAFPGGKADAGETAEDTALRESKEEAGTADAGGALKLLDRVNTPNGMVYSTFVRPVDKKFVPKLNDEHSGHDWAKIGALPQPVHPEVARVLGDHIGVGAESSPKDLDAARAGFAKWAREDADPAHAADDSLRTKTRDGYLQIARSPISKANIRPYLGREILEWRKLGLDPDRIYQMLCPPEELAKAAKTFNGIPLLAKHIPVSSKVPNRELWIGTVGTNAEFEDPYLYNSLSFWCGKGIEAVEDESKRELSASYWYRADMTPGIFGGMPFDGVMRDLVGNHVATVKEGRAGADVLAADSAPRKLKELFQMTAKAKPMSRKAVLLLGVAMNYLRPKLASDEAIGKIDLSPAFAGVTAANFKANKAKIIKAIETATNGKLAADADIADFAALLDELEEIKPIEAADAEPTATEPNAGTPAPVKKPDQAIDAEEPWTKAKAMLNGKVSAEDMKALDAIMCPKAADAEPEGESEEDKKKRLAAKGADAEPAKEPPITKQAMDAAMEGQRKKILADQKMLREAEREVIPYMGQVAVAFDSAADVYKAALEHCGIEIGADVPATGYRALLKALPVPKRNRGTDPVVAMDSAKAKSYGEMFPGAANIGQA